MSWRAVNPGTARYLLLLESNGYPLSNVERRATGQDPLPETRTKHPEGNVAAHPPAGWRLLPQTTYGRICVRANARIKRDPGRAAAGSHTNRPPRTRGAGTRHDGSISAFRDPART